MISQIKAHNFLSWETLTFDIKSGVTLIDGFNRDDNTSEGSGKSAVLNALCWGLYGKIPKDANIDDVIKSGAKGCEVKIFCDGFCIVRSRNKNDLYIETIDNKVTKGKDVRETQKMIEDLIGMSFDTFCQVIYFAQNYPKKFITATQEDKGKILSEVQDLQIFDKARKEVMSLIKNENGTLTQLQMKFQEKDLLAQGAFRELELITRQAEKDRQFRDQQIYQFDQQIAQKTQQVQNLDQDIQMLEDSKNDLTSLDDSQIQQLNNEIEQFNQAIAAIRHKLSDVDNHNKKLNDLKSEQQRHLNEKTRVDSQVSRLVTERERLNKFIENPESNCPTCGHELEAPDLTKPKSQLAEIVDSLQMYENQSSDLINKIQDLSSDINSFQLLNVNELNSDMSNINSQIYSRKNQINAHNSAVAEYSRINSKIDANKNFISGLVRDIQGIKNDKDQFMAQPQTDYSIQIKDKEAQSNILANEANDIKALIATKESYLSQLESLKEGYKEVKSYTFNSVLAELTIKSNKYLQELFEVPMTIRFTNDNMKIETQVTMNGEERGLGVLSGGQFRRTNLAVDLALSEIVALRTGSKMNIRILDEYFKDLSESSMEKCLRLLEKLGGSTILIEHNSIFKSIVDNVFECELVDGTTRSIA